MQATLQIPALTHGCVQLPPQDLERTQQLANVQIHIERVIGAPMQRYSILMSCITIDYVKPKADETIICSALNNLCKSVVPNN